MDPITSLDNLTEQQPKHQQLGSITPSELRNGPLINRNCTDLPCLLLLLIFTLISALIHFYSFHHGNLHSLIIPIDSSQQICGSKHLSNYKYLYFAYPISYNQLWKTVCVQRCPSGTETKLNCKPNKWVRSCSHSNKQFMIYPSKPFMDTICLPTTTKHHTLQNIIRTLKLDQLTELEREFTQTWKIMMLSLLTSLLVGVIFMLMMKYQAKLVVWIFIILFNVLLFLLTILFINRYLYLSSHPTDPVPKTILFNKQLMLFASIISSITFLVSLCYFLCSLKKINTTISILQTSSLFISHNPVSLLLPLITLIILITFISLSFYSYLHLYSIGTIPKIINNHHQNNNNNNKHPPTLIARQHSNITISMCIFQITILIIYCSILISSLNFILSSSTSIWYFQYSQPIKSFPPFTTSLYRLLRFHLGTIFMTSIILNFLTTIIQSLLQSVDNLCHNHVHLKPIQYLFKCCRCCLIIYHKYIMFIDNGVYTLCAIQGSPFLKSSIDSHYLRNRHLHRFNTLGRLCSLFYILGSSIITLLSPILFYCIDNHISSLSVTCSLFVAMVVSQLIMSVYCTVANAILIIFSMDQEIHKYHGSINTVPQSLYNIINIH